MRIREVKSMLMVSRSDRTLLLAVVIKEGILGINHGDNFNVSAKEDYMLRKVNWDKKVIDFSSKLDIITREALSDFLDNKMENITVSELITFFLTMKKTRFKERRIAELYETIASSFSYKVISKPITKRLYGGQYKLYEITETK